MSTQRDALGSCPLCGGDIPKAKLLIAYESDRGEDMYAECPDCLEVVHPR